MGISGKINLIFDKYVSAGDRQRGQSGRQEMGDGKRAMGSGRLKSRRHRRNPPTRVEEIKGDFNHPIYLGC